MKNLLLAITVLSASSGAATLAQAAVTPCENTLAELRATETSAKPSSADAAKFAELKTKGLERCNADDDKRANEFFGQALKLLGK